MRVDGKSLLVSSSFLRCRGCGMRFSEEEGDQRFSLLLLAVRVLASLWGMVVDVARCLRGCRLGEIVSVAILDKC